MKKKTKTYYIRNWEGEPEVVDFETWQNWHEGAKEDGTIRFDQTACGEYEVHTDFLSGTGLTHHPWKNYFGHGPKRRSPYLWWTRLYKRNSHLEDDIFDGDVIDYDFCAGGQDQAAAMHRKMEKVAWILDGVREAKEIKPAKEEAE